MGKIYTFKTFNLKSGVGMGLHIFVCVLAVICLTEALQPDLQVDTKPDGTYSVRVKDQLWLKSAPTFFRLRGRQFSTSDGSLTMPVPPQKGRGEDRLGTWSMVNYTYHTGAPHSGGIVNAYVRPYDHTNMVVFSQMYRSNVTGASTGDMDKVVSSFPGFHVGTASTDLGYMMYGGLFSGQEQLSIGRWKAGVGLPDGMGYGPLLLFDTSGNVLVISAFNQFMAHSMWHDKNSSSINYGIMGRVDAIPRNYILETIVYYSNQGINQALREWGSIMRDWYGKDAAMRYQDPTVKYVGYYTDNGAYYYHHTEPGLNYEDTMLGVLDYAKQVGIPYRYIQLDDWWYFVDGPFASNHGYAATVTWEAMPSVFPHGLRSFFNKTGLSVIAHNRYWSTKTTYAKQNGGSFNFFMDKTMSLPDDQAFWDFLFSQAVQWGLAVYEQDFLDHQTEHIGPLYSDIALGRRWLVQMGEAASRHGLRIQYCMALPRHILQSLEIPQVTQARVSIDYLLRTAQWKIGISSMYADAVGLAPFKDNAWTTHTQPGNTYNLSEPNPVREAVVALLSTGPVGPSDRIAYSDPRLIKRLHTDSGLLLKPSKPATAIDAQILQCAFGGTLGPVGEVWTTYSDISGHRFGIVFASDLMGTYRIGPTLAGFGAKFAQSKTISYTYKPEDTTKPPVPFSDLDPITLTGCEGDAMCLHYTFPILTHGSSKIGVLGELSKLVPVSPYRVTGITSGDNDIQITLKGTPGELVKFYLLQFNVVSPWNCVINDRGIATLSLNDRTCQ